MNKWSEIAIQTTHDAIEPVANILHEAGAGGVVLKDSQDLKREEWLERHGQLYQLELDPADYPDEGVILKSYLPVNQDLDETVQRIKTELTRLREHDVNLGRGTIALTEVREEDWAHAWKKYYKPVRITEKITIAPTWEEYIPRSDTEQVIELDPGMAFGTGTHPTTILSVQALEKVVQEGQKVIDIGCGSGVLSIAAVKLGAEEVLGLDIDDTAVKVARENIELNNVSSHIRVQQNDLLDHITEQADVVVANILAEVILRFVDDAYELLKPGGTFITSGIISRKKDDVEAALISHGFNIQEMLSMDDWISLVATKP